MSEEPLVKPGTVFRLPIRVSGFIEFRWPKDVRVFVDPYGWEYGPWPVVSPYGEDEQIVQIDDGGPGFRKIEADADVVESIRTLVDRFGMDAETPWTIEAGRGDAVTKGTE